MMHLFHSLSTGGVGSGVVERKEFDGKPVSRGPAERIRRSFRPSNLEQ